MRKFIAKEDIVIFSTTVIEKGEKIEVDKIYNLNYNGVDFPLSIESILSDKRFEEIIENKQELNFDVQEVTEDEELEIKKFRIQLDVTTNRRKLREIENFMRKTLENML
jgi:indole-3-glycerol phosphate synthase